MLALTALLCSLIAVILGRPITDAGLSGRSPVGSPAASTAETALQFLLRNDQDMCLLKLVCGAGANVSRYGVYTDSIAHSLGYMYQPFDFSVVRSSNLAEKLQLVGRDASNDLDDDLNAKQSVGSILIRVPKLGFKQDLTSMVKIMPSAPVYINKPVKVWRPAPLQWGQQSFVKPFPAVKTIATPTVSLSQKVNSSAITIAQQPLIKFTLPLAQKDELAVDKPASSLHIQAVTRVQSPILSVTKEIQETIQHLPTTALKVAPFVNLAASSFADQSNANAQNLRFNNPFVAGVRISYDLRPRNENLSISGNSKDFWNMLVTNETLDDDDLRSEDDVLVNKDNTEGAPLKDFTVATDVSEGEGGNEANEDSRETTSAPDKFTTSIMRSDAEVGYIVEPEERSGFPATYIFNRAFALGLRSGSEACSKTFGECPMNVDRIVRFGSNLFMSPASTSDQN